jgi:hypothetical protein
MLAELRSSRCGEKYYSGFVDGSEFDKFLTANVYLADGMGVFKTHSSYPLTREWIRTGKAKAVCTYRDPRDCVASDMAFMNLGFEKSVRRVAESLQSLDARSDFGRTLFVRYEDMMNDRPEQIRLIAAYLNIPIDAGIVSAIDEQTNLETTRKFVAQIPSLAMEAAPMLDSVSHRRHAQTLLHENHVGSAKPGRWKTDLTELQGKQLTHVFANYLLAFGYETVQSIQAILPQAGPPNVALPEPGVSKLSA